MDIDSLLPPVTMPVRLGPADTTQSLHARQRWDANLNQEATSMLRWAVIFLIIALVAALFGFTGIASAAAGIAKFLFFLFLVMCLIFFILGMSVAKKL
jgi:uncharacterized membrane protein YtjA (UPF0391 family)